MAKAKKKPKRTSDEKAEIKAAAARRRLRVAHQVAMSTSIPTLVAGVLLDDCEVIRVLRLDTLAGRTRPAWMDSLCSHADYGLDRDLEVGLRAYDSLERCIEHGLPTVCFAGPGGGSRLFRSADVLEFIDDQA